MRARLVAAFGTTHPSKYQAAQTAQVSTNASLNKLGVTLTHGEQYKMQSSVTLKKALIGTWINEPMCQNLQVIKN